MTDAQHSEQPVGRGTPLPFSLVFFAAMAPALVVWALMVLRGFSLVGGFEYPLDDVYIHLAMAEQISAGGYGVNAGEYASAASSPLYPFLLAALPGGGSARIVPFALNIVALTGCLFVWALIVARALPAKPVLQWACVGIAAAVPVAMNFVGATYTAMEHSLHILATLMIVLGLQKFDATGRVGLVLIIGVLAAPLLRLEGIAMALVAGGIVVIHGMNGRKAAGAALIVLAVAPLAAFMWWLTSLGLSPLPNSVMAKLGDGAGNRASFFQGFADSFVTNTAKTGGLILLVLCILAIVASAMSQGARKWIALGFGLAGFAHLFAGQIGWMHRYEIYAIAGVVAAIVVTGRMLVPLLGIVLAAGVYYVPAQMVFPTNSRAIHLQQTQMARFAQSFAKVPVAVNDLGRVAWGNPDYVLDLWGLANDEARAIRLGDSPNGWAGRLADEKGVKLAMIYDNWLSEAVPDTWEKIGTLTMLKPAGFLGGVDVSFYSTDADATSDLRDAARLFSTVLPDDAVYQVEGE